MSYTRLAESGRSRRAPGEDSDVTEAGWDPPALDEVARAVYARVVMDGGAERDGLVARVGLRPEDVDRACEVLIDLRLLVPGPEPRTLLPSDPEVAEAELTLPLEQDIQQRRQAVVRTQRQLQAMIPVYQSSRQPVRHDEDIRTVDDPAEVRRELVAASRDCAEEALTMQPGGIRRSGTLADAMTRDLAMLERGVRMRILYQHTARASLAVRRYVRRVVDAGAEVRTTTEPFERLIIFDRRVAFVPQPRTEGRTPGAVIVTQPVLVAFLRRVQENHWLGGQDFDAQEVHDEYRTDDLERSILRLMALGLKDDAVARRLGMSTRTCRRHVSSILDELGATSRFQAGVLAAARELVPPPEEADPAGPGGD